MKPAVFKSKLRSCWVVVHLLTCCILLSVSGEIYLEKLDSLYLPYSYKPEPQYGWEEDAAEQSAYDSKTHLLFSVGRTNVHVVDVSDPRTLRSVAHYDVGEGVEMTDVEFCGGYIFTGIHNKTDPENGLLMIFKYNNITRTLEPLHSVIVGPLPDMILPTKDCNTVFVALEAEAYVVNDVIVDPEGGFGILRWDSGNPSAGVTYRMLDFRNFNNRTEELVQKGLRFVYRENNNTLARDLEPEYITLNEDETLAYVCLQENSAIAVVNITDLDTADFIDIYPLGFKSWMNYTLDPSDKDGGAIMKRWPVYGVLQPDSIHYFTHNGEGFIVTANEGDSKEYLDSSETVLFSEEKRGKDLITENLVGDNIDAVTRGYLDDQKQLGRLKLQVIGDADGGSQVERLYSYGGRGFSIVRARDMEVVYDSGDTVEESILYKYPVLFNCDPEGGLTPWECTDRRSDDKGPECESLSVGKLGEATVIFMGNERPGTISIFSIADDSFMPRFESVYFGGTLVEGRTWEEMYERRTSGDVDPEDVKFVSSENSPNGEPLLLVSGAVSGTISTYAVRSRDDVSSSSTPGPSSGSTDPVNVVCTDAELKCRNTNRCVSVKYKCDGVDDCGDNTDEAGCTSANSDSLTMEQTNGLVIAVVCLTSLCLIVLIALCFLVRTRRSQNEYEMKTKL